MASYCICIKCHRTWIVSKLDPPPKSNYICPACADPNFKEVNPNAR